MRTTTRPWWWVIGGVPAVKERQWTVYGPFAVVTLQEVFKLATEPYTPPAPMRRSADVASDVTIDV